MNWTGGNLQRHSRGGKKASAQRQRAYFAKSRVGHTGTHSVLHSSNLARTSACTDRPSLHAFSQSPRPQRSQGSTHQISSPELNPFDAITRLAKRRKTTADTNRETKLERHHIQQSSSHDRANRRALNTKRTPREQFRAERVKGGVKTLLDCDDWLGLAAAKPLKLHTFGQPEGQPAEKRRNPWVDDHTDTHRLPNTALRLSIDDQYAKTPHAHDPQEVSYWDRLSSSPHTRVFQSSARSFVPYSQPDLDAASDHASCSEICMTTYKTTNSHGKQQRAYKPHVSDYMSTNEFTPKSGGSNKAVTTSRYASMTPDRPSLRRHESVGSVAAELSELTHASMDAVKSNFCADRRSPRPAFGSASGGLVCSDVYEDKREESSDGLLINTVHDNDGVHDSEKDSEAGDEVWKRFSDLVSGLGPGSEESEDGAGKDNDQHESITHTSVVALVSSAGADEVLYSRSDIGLHDPDSRHAFSMQCNDVPLHGKNADADVLVTPAIATGITKHQGLRGDIRQLDEGNETWRQFVFGFADDVSNDD